MSVLAKIKSVYIIGFGGIVFAIFLRGAAKHETIPVHDPRILESINYHE
jgi:hypothetical protein